MSDSMKAIHDDIESYNRMCRYFGESVRFTRISTGQMVEDCYGPHAKELKKKYEEEQKQNVQRCPHCHKIIN